MSRWCRDWIEELPPQVTKHLHPKACVPPERAYSRLDGKVGWVRGFYSLPELYYDSVRGWRRVILKLFTLLLLEDFPDGWVWDLEVIGAQSIFKFTRFPQAHLFFYSELVTRLFRLLPVTAVLSVDDLIQFPFPFPLKWELHRSLKFVNEL
jgi:hypothetical protein